MQTFNTAQKRYTTNERDREMVSAIETCKKYKNILLGYHQPNIVFTDYKKKNIQWLKNLRPYLAYILAFTP
jgi:hypothetical protein